MAAERLGVPLRSVTVELGDSRLPAGPVAGGSNTTASSCSAVKACNAMRRKLFRSAVMVEEGALAGRDPAQLTLESGQLLAHDGAAEPLAEAFQRLGTSVIEVPSSFPMALRRTR